MSPVPISCYIRACNEASRIGPVVAAARILCREVIVIDSGSIDDTVVIAEAHGARVLYSDWLGNGHQKRIGEEAAAHDWLLDLDADEVLSKALLDEISSLFSVTAPDPGIFSLLLVTVPPVPKGAVWHRANLGRRNKLYHRDIARMPAHPAWDQLDLPPNTAVTKLQGPLYHYSFSGIEQQMAKMNRVSSVRANETPLKPVWLLRLRILFGFPFYLSKKLFRHGMYRAGIYGFACAAVIASNRWLKDVKMYEIHLARNGRNEL